MNDNATSRSISARLRRPTNTPASTLMTRVHHKRYPAYRCVARSHTLYEPKERVHIGVQPPLHHDRSRIIPRVTVGGGSTDAFKDVAVDLNCGLVAIIGQKGSGKSALADMLAYAGGIDVSVEKQSFLHRAVEYVENTTIILEWLDGQKTMASPGRSEEHTSELQS